MKRAGAAALMMTVACGRGTGGQPASGDRDVPTQAQVQKGSEMTSAIEVTAELVEVAMRRPPLTELRVDVTAHNISDEARWLVLPQTLKQSPATEGGVSTLQILRGDDAVIVARSLGRRSFQAVLLAPGAAVTLRRLEIDWWRPDTAPTTLELVAVVARAITIGGKPLEAEMGDGATATGTQVSAERRLRAERSWSDTMAEVPVVIDEIARSSIALDLAHAPLR